jgi:proteasome lid subunit RPN8/RPN11
MLVTLSRKQFGQLHLLAQRTYPHECCGVLLGRDQMVIEVVPCTNEVTERSDRYRIPPMELIAAQKRARAQGQDIIGFYHSHPDHPPEPSTTDIAEAHWFGCVYIIISISVQQAMAGQMRAFVLEGNEQQKRFSEVQVRVHP